MELISTFKQANCPVLKFGLKKISMNYYFCKDCDKEEKLPMCKNCIMKCHKGHQASDKHPASKTDLIRCSCAMNNHQTSTEEANYPLNTCFFYELNKVTEDGFCYQNIHKQRICNFCYTFCRPNSKHEEEFKLEFKKINLDHTGHFKCKCPSFNNSKHTAVDFMSKCLNDINKSTSSYFPQTNPVMLTNLYFGSNELFRSVNKKFLGVFEKLIMEYGDRFINMEESYKKKTYEELHIKIPGIVIRTYYIFKSNAFNCKNQSLLIFVKEVSNFFSEKVFKFFIGNCQVGFNMNKGNYKTEENFYESFLYGYKIFNIYPNFFNNSTPRLHIFEFINLTPYQRMLIKKNSKISFNYDIDFLLCAIKEISKTVTPLLSVKILIQLLSILKTFASIYYLNKEQINDFLKHMDTFFLNLDSTWEDVKDKSHFIKFYKIFSKILIYFSFFYNDLILFDNIEEVYEQGKNSKNNQNNFSKFISLITNNNNNNTSSKNENNKKNKQKSKRRISVSEVMSTSKNVEIQATKKQNYEEDENFNKEFFNNDKIKNKSKYIFSDGEINRNLAKCVIHITRCLEREYRKIGSFTVKQSNEYFNVISLVEILMSLVFYNGKDVYIPGMLIMLKNLKKEGIKFIFEPNFVDEDLKLFLTLKKEESELNQRISDYYTSSKELNPILEAFHKSISKMLTLFKNRNNNETLDILNKSNSSMSSEDSFWNKNNNQNNQDITIISQNGKSVFNRSGTEIRSVKETISPTLGKVKTLKISRTILSPSKENTSIISPPKSQASNIFLMANLSGLFLAASNIFNLTTDKTVFDREFCSCILDFIYWAIAQSPNLFLVIISEQMMRNLRNMPEENLPRILNIIIKGLEIFSTENLEISYREGLCSSIYKIFIENIQTEDIELQYRIICSVLHIFNILAYDKKGKINKITIQSFFKKKIMCQNAILNIIKKYKEYLIELSTDFLSKKAKIQKKQKDKKNVSDNESDEGYDEDILNISDFNEYNILKKYFFSKVPIDIVQNIFHEFLNLLIYSFDGETLSSSLSPIRDLLPSSEISQFLKITIIPLSLRISLLRTFRLLHQGPSIDKKKLNLYRTEFQSASVEETSEIVGLPPEQKKIFKFGLKVLEVSPMRGNEEEYEVIAFEAMNFEEITKNEEKRGNIIYNSRDIIKSYFEEGILLSSVIYFNKAFCRASKMRGKELLKMYRLAYNVLKVMKKYRESIEESHIEYKGIPLPSSVILSSDLRNMTSKSLSPFNYVSLYNLLDSRLLRLFDESVRNKILKTDFDIGTGDEPGAIRRKENIEKNKKNENINRKNHINSKIINNNKKKETNLDNIGNDNDIVDKFDLDNEQNLIDPTISYTEYQLRNPLPTIEDIEEEIGTEYAFIYFGYIVGKADYESSSFKEIFDLNYAGNENTFRTILCKFLLIMLTNENKVNEEQILQILIRMLRYENTRTQNIIMNLYVKRDFTKFNVIIEKSFFYILSTIFDKFNPAYAMFNSDYISCCSFIKFFNFLCQGHNHFFQKVFLKQFFFSLNDIQKISFYDMMLYVLEKIIVLSSWKSVTIEEEFDPTFVQLFSYIIEMLVEMIQGTEDSNFQNIINQKLDLASRHDVSANRLDPLLKKGKAIESFIGCAKGLISKDIHSSENLNRIRKVLMDFFLAFLEEYHCPIDLKLLIVQNFHSSKIIMSISTILKRMYVMLRGEPGEGRKVYFNAEIGKYFEEVYFRDYTLFHYPSFQLCCSFYNFFKLTLIQLKYSESLLFWKKLYSLKEDSLQNFEFSSAHSTFANDASEFEAFNVVNMFEKISKSVLVKIKEDKPPIYVIFTKPPCLDYLSEQTKLDFLENVNRQSRNTKLIELMEQTEYFRIESEYNFHKLRNRPIMKRLCWLSYFYFNLFIFLLDLFLNFCLLLTVHQNGLFYIKEEYYFWIRVVSLGLSLVVLLAIILWSLTKVELFKKLEEVKYMQLQRIKSRSSLSSFDSLIIFVRVYLHKGELSSLACFLLFKVLGSLHRSFAFFYSFSLLSVMSLSDSLNSLLQSLALKGRRLLWVFFFITIVLYVYGGWGFFFLHSKFYDELRENPENLCESLLYCFFTLVNNGMRWYPGIGKVLRTDSAIEHSRDYIHNYIYHFSFYLIIRVMMLKIVFGIILESFKELREIKANKEKDWKYKCFICNIEKDECEKKNFDFVRHCSETHNLWDYANYMIMLRMADFQSLNGINSMCKKMILDRKMKWIPDSEIVE